MRMDAAVVGSGPNGLAAAVTMARAGLRVRVYERAHQPGGSARTAELIAPGHFHDLGSAVHPMVLASPFFQAFGLARRIELVTPELSYAHPFETGGAGLAYRDLARTAEGLGPDGAAYRRLFAPLAGRLDGLADFTLNQLLRLPRDPAAVLAFGPAVLEQGSWLWNRRFRAETVPAMLSGLMAHVAGRQPSLSAAGAGLMLGATAHAGGWPLPVGGSQSITGALLADLRAHGGELVTGHEVRSFAELDAAVILADVSPPAFLRLAHAPLPPRYARALGAFRYGDAASKVDFILSAPVPWRDPELAGTAVVHLGGTRAGIAAAEAQVAAGRHPERPYVIVSQPSGFDPTRAPAGRHILWTYCHVPAGSTVDMTRQISARIEAVAPGFADVVIASQATTAAGLAEQNPNTIGGDFSGGALSLPQLLRRPVVSTEPWRTPLSGVYLCSASTPPGPAVHGMAGFHAARAALKHEFGLPVPRLAP